MDLDGDNKINCAEFINVAADQVVNTEDSLRHIFDLFDQDGNGEISLDEIKRQLRDNDKSHLEAKVMEIFTSIDTDGNFKIDWDEFKKGAGNFLKGN